MKRGQVGHRYEVRFSGTGGQGVVLAGIILAEAARLRGGQYVVQTVSYGPQVRGGMSSAELVISGEEIDYPKPLGLDMFLPFTQEAYSQGIGSMKSEGLICIDPVLVGQPPEGRVAVVPMTQLAEQATGRRQMANIVALGAIAALAPVVDTDSMAEAVKERAPKGLEDAFIEALDLGVKTGEEIQQNMTYGNASTSED
jgi:2-oxoglutarate ferredoxin oxidoreductase subunit gamma